MIYILTKPERVGIMNERKIDDGEQKADVVVTKLPYARPTVECLGDVADLTMKTGTKTDNSSNPTKP